MKLSTGRKLLFAAAAALLFFALIEASLRLVGYHAAPAAQAPVQFVGIEMAGSPFLEPDDDLFWRLKPGAELPHSQERVSAQGFRGPDFRREKPPAVRRIVCLGDSCTFGFFVPEARTFARRLECRLSGDEASRYEVLNLGVPGYSTYQIWRSLVTRSRDFHPDAVVVYPAAWNDFVPAIRWDDERRADFGRRYREAGPGFFESLRSAQLLGEAIAPLRARIEARRRDSAAKEFAERQAQADGPRVPLDSFRRLLQWIARDARGSGAKVVLIVPPAPKETRVRFADSDRYAEAIREEAANCSDALVDARSSFIESGRDDAALFVDFIHPTEEGHERLLRLLARALQDLGVGNDSREPGTPDALDLLESMLKAEVGLGAPPVRIDLAGPKSKAPARCVLTGGASRLRLAPLSIAPYMILAVGCALDGAESGSPVHFEIRAEVSGTAPQVVLSETLTAGEDGRARSERHAMPLRALAGRTVSLVFEINGRATRAGWVDPRLEDCR